MMKYYICILFAIALSSCGSRTCDDSEIEHLSSLVEMHNIHIDLQEESINRLLEMVKEGSSYKHYHTLMRDSQVSKILLGEDRHRKELAIVNSEIAAIEKQYSDKQDMYRDSMYNQVVKQK